ncbi:J domain-containing protein [Ensifer sp. WSM1721]|uniref:J domain-containing protein n=1 Tax=Ensifer sp. WSM1721 TaxID=1041159 RepID=UPI0018DBC52D|nr:J domain-containing protein [Ensifer sp. WSM1721]
MLAATRDSALSISEITDNAYELGGRKPTREQRLSATRAAHRLLRRIREKHKQAEKLISRAHKNTEAALGRKCYHENSPDKEYIDRFERDPAYVEARRLFDYCDMIGTWGQSVPVPDKRGYYRWKTHFWKTTTVRKRLFFHPPDVPVQVWAISIDRNGIAWFEAEITRITERNVVVRYRGEAARLDRRQLWHAWAWWRGVCFVSSQTGRMAEKLDKLWWSRFGTSGGGVPPSMQVPLVEAMELLGVSSNYSREEVIKAFRKKALKAHPDQGGTAEMFRKLVEARDRLLAAIGTEAAKPEEPRYAPKGAIIVYRRVRASSRRIGSSTQLLS